MAAGMAKQGLTPVFAVYSTFLQRSYDMLIHDIAIQGLHVILAVDRAGLVGEDGETHHGVFDVAFLDTVPGMTVLCPASFSELRTMLAYAVKELSGPVALRYPRGGEGEYTADSGTGHAALLRQGEDITLVGYGVMINEVLRCADALSSCGVSAEVIKLNTITPIDVTLVQSSISKTTRLLVAEDVMDANCVGRRLAAELALAGSPGCTYRAL